MNKFDIPEPKRLAPQLTAEQRQTMAPIDLLVQYIMPKMLDKVNYLEWAVKAELHSVKESLEELRTYADKIGADADSDILRLGGRVDEMERALADARQVEEKSKRNGRRKKAEDKAVEDTVPPIARPLDSEPRAAAVDTDILEPVAMSAVARYDAATDQWMPKVVDGVEITASVVDMVATGVGTYSTEVAAFIYDMSESERKVLCDLFPDETTEEVDNG